MINNKWWEKIDCQDNTILQGDIINNCMILEPQYISVDNNSLNAKCKSINGIIMTQSCDIENGKVNNILLCTIIPTGEFIQELYKMNKSEKEIINYLDSIKKGMVYSYYMLDKCDDESEYYIVNFNETYSILLNDAIKFAKNTSIRYRLLSPYREHLSQAFAKYFMRVGLPNNIDINTKEVVNKVIKNIGT